MRTNLDRASTEEVVVEAVGLERWEALHPVAQALLAGDIPPVNPHAQSEASRSPQLASALAEQNRRWGNPVDNQLEAWLEGAKVVVAGQQPGVLGGPILSLVKACAVAALVAKLQAEGQKAVGFFWLETRDDDLPEMGWARLALGGELFSSREPWQRAQACACAVPLSSAVVDLLASIPHDLVPEPNREALQLAQSTFQPGTALGEACGHFLAQALGGLGLVLVDASLPEVATAGVNAGQRLLSRLEEAWALLVSRELALKALSLPPPLRLRPDRLPFFAVKGGKRRALGSLEATSVSKALATSPAQFYPNVWLRPLLQDAALDSSVAILGSTELAYHWQVQDLWPLAGVSRPHWCLRPHLTLVSSREARWLVKLGLAWDDLVSRKLPQRLSEPKALLKHLRRFQEKSLESYHKLAEKARRDLPNLAAELEATETRLQATFTWLEQRLRLRAEQQLQTQDRRWVHLRQALRPLGRPQERALSVLSPFLNLPEGFPHQLVATLACQYPWEPKMLITSWQARR